ncbi:hypothetical protein VNO78_15250 [Psophocarpus tetragonolobus]|uniref:Uncharacterized protein n=1 Tax=Psophocarpus tetragonolobus TaxID=3891 RepID=A0AAN9SEQ9_PSOTE
MDIVFQLLSPRFHGSNGMKSRSLKEGGETHRYERYIVYPHKYDATFFGSCSSSVKITVKAYQVIPIMIQLSNIIVKAQLQNGNVPDGKKSSKAGQFPCTNYGSSNMKKLKTI